MDFMYIWDMLVLPISYNQVTLFMIRNGLENSTITILLWLVSNVIIGFATIYLIKRILQYAIQSILGGLYL